MANISYLDFDLLVENAGDQYSTRVLNSPAGQATASFRLPFSELELENFYLKIGRSRRSVRRLDSPQLDAAKDFGGRLFKAVFDDEVLACLHNSLAKAEGEGVGLRLRLHLNASELTNLPWEFFYMTALDRFLVLAIETPLVRYLELPLSIRPLKVKPPLKILVMVSSPTDFAQLDIEQEWSNLKNALADLEKQGLLVLERLEEATLVALQRHLRRDEFHIFHFIGHGTFDERTQDGILLLEDESQRGHRVSGKYLGTLLHNHPPLRLAVLNSCEGARTSRTDPFAGTAQGLVRQGLPAVIAMQFEITDVAAIAFAQEFYATIADGYLVDAALSEVRASIFAHGNDVEWGTPVLYMRAPDGRIFDIERELANALEAKRLQTTAPVAGNATIFPKLSRTTPTTRVSWQRFLIVSLAALILGLIALFPFKHSVLRQRDISAEKLRLTKKDSVYAKYRNAGNILFNQGQFAEAKSRYDSALVYMPGDGYVMAKIEACEQRIAEQNAQGKNSIRCIRKKRTPSLTVANMPMPS